MKMILASLLLLPSLSFAQLSQSGWGDAAWREAALQVRPLEGETPFASFILSDIARKQDASGLPVDFGGKTYKLTLSFGKDYAQFLTVRNGSAKTVIAWNDLAKGVKAGPLTLTLTDGALAVCPDSGASCAVLGEGALLIWAFNEQGKALTIGPVHYSLLLDPSGAYVGMLRQDADEKFFVGIYALADLQKDAGWFLGLNQVLYGMRFDGKLLNVVREPVPPTATSLFKLTAFQPVTGD